MKNIRYVFTRVKTESNINFMKTYLHSIHNTIYILLLVCMLCFSCKNTRLKEEVSVLTPDLQIAELSDSTFFSNINCMVEYQGDIYASLHQRTQIIRLDKDLNLKNTIGRPGRGPGEFIFTDKFFVVDDIVWAGNPGVRAMMKFSIDGNFLGVERKTKNRYALNVRLGSEDGIMYFTMVDEDKKTSLAALDLNKDGSDAYRQFGPFVDFGSTTKNQNQNSKHVFLTRDHIFAVPISIPVIEKYDRNTLELLETYDMTTYLPIKENYKAVIEDPEQKAPNTSYSLVNDAYLHNGILYLICAGMAERNGKMERIGIMAFDTSGSIRYIKRYAFEEVPARICVTDEYLYAAAFRGGVIERYPLNQ